MAIWQVTTKKVLDFLRVPVSLARRRVCLRRRVFLVERISNVRSRFLSGAVRQSLTDAVKIGLLTKADALETLDVYAELMTKHMIDASGKSSVQAIRNQI